MGGKRLNPTLIGAFILGAMVLGIGALLYFGSDRLSGEKVHYVAYFHSDTGGLDPGAPVTLRGVQIGNVSAIRVGYAEADKAFFVRVEMAIDRGAILWPQAHRAAYLRDVQKTYRDMIEQGLRARLALQSFVTGKLVVQLGFYPDTALRLHGEALEFPTIPTPLERLMDGLTRLDAGALIDQVDHLLKRLNAIADATDIGRVQTRLNTALEAIELSARTLQGQSSDLGRQLDGVLTDLNRLTLHLDAKVDGVSGSIEQAGGDMARLARRLDHTLPPLIQDLRGASVAVTKAAAATNATLTTLGEAVAENSPLRLNTEEAMSHLSAAAQSLRDLADYLDRHPEALLQGKFSR